MATDANLRSDATPRPEDDLRCWRAFHGNQCQRPIDWRERCKATEEDIAAAAGEVRVSLDEIPPGSKMRRVVIANRLLLHERNESWGRVVDLDRENTALVEQLFAQAETAERLIAEQHEATAREREQWQLFADRRWEEVWSRDDALDACQKRISSLLDRISGLLSESVPHALTDALADITRIAGERDRARRQVAALQATVLGLLAVLRPLEPEHAEVLRGMLRTAQAELDVEENLTARGLRFPIALARACVTVAALRAALGEERTQQLEPPPLEPACPGPDCPMCSGSICNLCGAGCWNNAAPYCAHATDERHREPLTRRSSDA